MYTLKTTVMVVLSTADIWCNVLKTMVILVLNTADSGCSFVLYLSAVAGVRSASAVLCTERISYGAF